MEFTWAFVSMNFSSGFPKVNGKMLVMVMVNQIMLFIIAPIHCSSELAAKLFYKFMVKNLMFHLIL